VKVPEKTGILRFANIPCQIQPLPDEHLRSFEPRVWALNGLSISAGRTVLEAYAERHFDEPLSRSAAQAFLSVAAHASSVDVGALRSQLTTQPYRDAFLPAEAHKIERWVPKLRETTVYVCSACAIADRAKYGVHYLHRIHQLGVACPAHGLMPTQGCSACGRRFLAKGRFDIASLHRCPCGATSARSLRSRVASEAERDLSKLTLLALNATPHAIDLSLASPLMAAHAMRREGMLVSASIDAALRRTFGDDSPLNPNRVSPDGVPRLHGPLGEGGGSDGARGPCSQTKYSRRLAPRTVLMLAVACEISWEQLQSEVDDMRRTGASGAMPARRWRQREQPETLAEAKRIANEFARGATKRTNLRVRRPWAYWWLFLRAPKWLHCWMGGMATIAGRRILRLAEMGCIPSEEDDREYLMSHTRSTPSRSAALSRARVRDREWLDHWEAVRTAPHANRLPFDAIKGLLEVARAKNLKRLGRPRRWCPGIAAEYLQLSDAYLGDVMLKDPSARGLLLEPLETFYRRKIAWAIDVCRERKTDFCRTDVLKVSGLPPKRANLRLIREGLGLSNEAPAP